MYPRARAAAGIVMVMLACGQVLGAPPAACDGAFVDVDRDGVCGAGDLALTPLLQAGRGAFDATVAAGAYVPPADGRPVDVVIDSLHIRPTSGQWPLAFIHTTGDVRILRRLTASAAISIDVEAANIDIADGARVGVTGRYAGLILSAEPAGTVQVGRRARLVFQHGGSISGADVILGDGVRLGQTSAIDYGAHVDLRARTWHLGTGVRIRSAQTGYFFASVYGDVAAVQLQFRGGMLELFASCDERSPGAKHIAFDDGRFFGPLHLVASCDGSDPPDAIVLRRSRFPSKSVFTPTPLIER